MSVTRPLWLDYQRPPPGRHWPGFVLLAVSLLLGGLLLAQSFSIAAQLAASEQQVSRLKREAERRRLLAAMERPAAGAVEREARLSSPSAARWEALLLLLENASNDSVTLLSLEPGSRDVSLVGEASNLGASLDYVERLQAASVFADVHLVKHEIVRENPNLPVRFALQARWREAAR